MSIYTRIDPNHPLTQAAREVNAQAEVDGIEQVLDTIGLDVGLSEFAYLAEQRGLRALASAEGINLGQPGTEGWQPDVEQAAELRTLTAAYMDGMTIGFRAAQIVAEPKKTTRYALVRNASSSEQLSRYLPDNYRLVATLIERAEQFSAVAPGSVEVTGEKVVYVIAGEDSHGWTMDDYVIPRLASGLIWAEEIDAGHPLFEQVEL